jgi:hypothetical protein
MAKNPKSKQMKVVSTGHEAIETTSEVFSDGTALELIRPGSEAGETSLLRWDGSSATIGQEFEKDGKIYRPPQLHSTSLRALRLPGRIAPYGSTSDLFDGIRKVLKEYTDLAESYVWQLAYFFSGSWLADRLLVAPLLCIIAPLGVEKAQLLRLLSILCRRPLMLAEVTPAAISNLARLGPTFIFDEPNMSRRAGRLLYTTNNYRRFALGNGRIMDALSAKVICSQEPLGDSLLASQALEITLSPTGRVVPFLGVDACEQIADEFQSKLLQYRLTNLGKIRTPEFDVSELMVPMQDVARSLGACVVDDEKLQLGVVELLRECGRDVHLDSSTELGSAILEALLFCSHKGRPHVLSGELADIVNAIWEKRGEGRKITPESVGWKLKALDLRTEPIDGAGKGLRLTEAVRARIHAMARAYKIPSLREAAQEECPHCKVAFGKK